jgi:hypothetical protein
MGDALKKIVPNGGKMFGYFTEYDNLVLEQDILSKEK